MSERERERERKKERESVSVCGVCVFEHAKLRRQRKRGERKNSAGMETPNTYTHTFSHPFH